MSYTSIGYYILVLTVYILYYLFPKKYRWILLLAGSCTFYVLACKDAVLISVFGATLIVSYIFSLLLQRQRKNRTKDSVRKATLAAAIITCGSVFFVSKLAEAIPAAAVFRSSFLLPLGLSFYTLQLLSYLTDIYKGRIDAQKNFFRYVLFMSFFPQIIQGPIPRYELLSQDLYKGNEHNERQMMGGLNTILWGFFLKFMIADKAGIVTHTIDATPQAYRGLYIAVSCVMYTIHLYADFLSCVTISQGVAQLFGIPLSDNFRRPFFSLSVKELWQRWHISLGAWLRDYIYIPLGGSKKGKFRKYLNLSITFIASGLWHGVSLNYVCWGFLQAVLQVFEELSGCFKRKRSEMNMATKTIKALYTFGAMNLGVLIFKSESITNVLTDLRSVIEDANLWIFFDRSLFRLGLNEKECFVLFVSLLILLVANIKKEQGFDFNKWFLSRHRAIRWCIYLLLIWSIWIFGTYGYGFDSSAFIYGGF